MFRLARHWKKLTGSVAVSAALGGAVFLTATGNKEDPEKNRQLRAKENQIKIPSREEHLAKLKSKTLFDVLVIGGGATGTGIALDCATRGINVALVEREDFASGTSSRSTKLIHGGVRYLEAAIKNLDYSQVHLVFEALHERTTFLNIAPHLTRKLPLLTPCYKWYEIPYMYTGLAMYDLLSGKGKLGNTAIISKAKSLEKFPQLASKNLKGTILYYDGQMNDSRMNVSLATTAAVKGASLANYVEVVELLKDKTDSNKLIGAKVKDNLTGEVWDIHAKIIVNATGPYVDHIRLMNDPTAPKMIKPSNGTHIIIPQKFASKEAGILIPKTKDGRVLFLLPWENRVLAGTTDSEAELLDHPVPQQQEVDFILEELNRILAEPVTQNDVLSVWSGIRPLAKQLKVKENQSTKAISRDHVVEVSDNGLLTITGGKWTTYRKMAQDIVDRVENREEMAQRPKIKCFTDEVPLIGALGYNSAEVQEELKRKFHRYNKAEKKHHPFDDDIAEHLAHSYGSRAAMIGELAQQGYGQRLAPEHPFLEAEVVYCATNEYACTAVDVLARRTRLAFLDTNAARKALPRVIDLMATTLKWDAKRKLKEEDNALKFLETMHVNAPK